MNLKNRYVRAVTLEGKGKLTLKDYPYPELKPNCAKLRFKDVRKFK